MLGLFSQNFKFFYRVLYSLRWSSAIKHGREGVFATAHCWACSRLFTSVCVVVLGMVRSGPKILQTGPRPLLKTEKTVEDR